MSDKCFRKCISYPGTDLENREQVSASYLQRLCRSEFPNLSVVLCYCCHFVLCLLFIPTEVLVDVY